MLEHRTGHAVGRWQRVGGRGQPRQALRRPSPRRRQARPGRALVLRRLVHDREISPAPMAARTASTASPGSKASRADSRVLAGITVWPSPAARSSRWAASALARRGSCGAASAPRSTAGEEVGLLGAYAGHAQQQPGIVAQLHGGTGPEPRDHRGREPEPARRRTRTARPCPKEAGGCLSSSTVTLRRHCPPALPAVPVSYGAGTRRRRTTPRPPYRAALSRLQARRRCHRARRGSRPEG